MPDFDLDSALSPEEVDSPSSRKWKVVMEVCMPDQDGTWTETALARQCRAFEQSHSRDGSVDGRSEMDWVRDDYGDILFEVTVWLSAPHNLIEDEARDEAVGYWEVFAPLWLSNRCFEACGFANVIASYPLEAPHA